MLLAFCAKSINMCAIRTGNRINDYPWSMNIQLARQIMPKSQLLVLTASLEFHIHCYEEILSYVAFNCIGNRLLNIFPNICLIRIWKWDHNSFGYFAFIRFQWIRCHLYANNLLNFISVSECISYLNLALSVKRPFKLHKISVIFQNC